LTLSLAAALAAGACSRLGRQTDELPPHPVAEFPAEIDLGKRERGEIAVAAFTVANRGGAELLMEGFQSNCSCSGIERRKGSEFVRLDSLRLQPGEEVELQMRVSVRGVPIGARARNGVQFRTNDPDKPSGQIDAVITQVTGGVFTVPDKVVVGAVPVGTTVRHVFQVRDDAITPRSLERVTSTLNRVKVRILDEAEVAETASAVHGGISIARVEVEVDTSTPGNIDGEVNLHLAGAERPPDAIRVFGRVADAIDLSPSALVLPRSSPEGLIYTTNCIVRSTEGKLITVAVDSCPPHLSVKIPSSGQEPVACAIITVTLDPNSPSLAAKERDNPIRLRCRMGDTESVVELRVLITP
jgi:hypothetical protein